MILPRRQNDTLAKSVTFLCDPRPEQLYDIP